MKTLIIVSYFDERPIDSLLNLLRQLECIGLSKLVVINTNGKGDSTISDHLKSVEHIYRENSGMNIGAWNEGASRAKNYTNLIFMQDECFIKNTRFHDTYCRFLEDPQVGIVGESINRKWCNSWEDLRQSPLNYVIPGVGVNRVDYYVNKLNDWGIDPGNSGGHLRALALGMRRDLFFKLGGFIVGESKEDCIAAEIGISRKVVARGLSVVQSAYHSFTHIGHLEWATSVEFKVQNQSLSR